MSEQRVKIMQMLKASEDAKAFYDRMANKIISLNNRYKKLTSLEIVSIVARLLGVMIAQVGEAERDLAKELALLNIESAISKIHPLHTESKDVVHDPAKNAG